MNYMKYVFKIWNIIKKLENFTSYGLDQVFMGF